MIIVIAALLAQIDSELIICDSIRCVCNALVSFYKKWNVNYV